ncbi:MAG: hypothetical protein N3I86_06340 [Verrucomicrobiae bacterium]|nr:hypothetical protein [Verrucomicrobiae bacterium]
MTARVKAGAGWLIGSVLAAWVVVPCYAGESSAKAQPVTIGPDGFLRIGGRPHFPIGLYSATRFPELARAGFTAVHSYAVVTGDADTPTNATDARLQTLLDSAASNGLRMKVELPRLAVEQAKWEQVRRRIERFRDHPGLLCWGSEERVARGRAPLENVCALYRLVRELDPHHPFVLGDTRDVIKNLQKDRRLFFPDDCMDVGIWWWYPIPLRAAQTNLLEGSEAAELLLQPPSWLTTTLSKKPLWIAIQAYQKPQQDARFPTPAEYRCMAYLSLINGVKGLWFYTGSGQRDWQGKPAGLLNKPVEAHWDYVQQLVRELRELEPVIVAESATAEFKLASTNAPVEFAARKRGGVRYLFAANKSGRPQQVRFQSRALATGAVSVLYESHRVAPRDGVLFDELPPLGARVYRIE